MIKVEKFTQVKEFERRLNEVAEKHNILTAQLTPVYHPKSGDGWSGVLIYEEKQ